MTKVKTFLKETNLEHKLLSFSLEKPTSSELDGKIYVFTGFRDYELEKMILSKGGKIATTITKNTYKLITKSMDKSSLKIKRAIDYKIPISIYPDY